MSTVLFQCFFYCENHLNTCVDPVRGANGDLGLPFLTSVQVSIKQNELCTPPYRAVVRRSAMMIMMMPKNCPEEGFYSPDQAQLLDLSSGSIGVFSL